MEIYRIDVPDYPELKRKFYNEIVRYPTINAVISNVQGGFVYSDIQRNNLFVATKFGWSILLVEDKSTINTLFDFLKKNLEIPDYIHIYPPNNPLIKYIESNWPKFKIRKRCQYRYLKHTQVFNYKKILPDGYSIIKIQDIEFSKLDVFKFDLGNRYWQSKEDFLRNSLGVCLMNSLNEPIGICYSIAIADKIAEAEIFILSDYRGKGFGQAISQAFVNLTIDNGIVAHWDTFSDNTPSMELVKRSGFQKIQEYSLVSTFLRDW